MATRPVDGAMEGDRPEKRAVRTLWLEEVDYFLRKYPDERDPLYVTLPGREARDIGLLIDRGVLDLTETGAISEASFGRVIAVESSAAAYTELQQRMPGLKILRTTVANFVQGNELHRFPEGEHERFCRARIINLDLNQVLHAENHEGEHFFPVMRWITKLGVLHARRPRKEWSLCLTLHGEIQWDAAVNLNMREFLRENFQRSADFLQTARNVLENELAEQILAGDARLNFRDLPREIQQKVLMVMVPKIIVESIRDQRWSIDTRYNLHYGQQGHAPMVTWVFRFAHGVQGAAAPERLNRRNLEGTLVQAGFVDATGNVVMYV